MLRVRGAVLDRHGVAARRTTPVPVVPSGPSDAEPIELRPTACDFCGTEFVSKRVRGRWTRACSLSCARRLQIVEGTPPFLGRLPAATTEETR